jgi:hypothetical protein
MWFFITLGKAAKIRVCMWSFLQLFFKSSPVTGLEWPRGSQEVKIARFLDNGTGWW